MSLSGKTIALCVTGSIAAYKAVEVARLLVKRGANVLPVLTPSATKFVGGVTFAGITANEARVDMWDASYPGALSSTRPAFGGGEMHVHIAEQADAICVVPATADTLAKLATGRADDLVSALVLCAKSPIVLAPAMHPRMWTHAATRANVAVLAAREGVRFAGPVSGAVASGHVGMGRMMEPEDVVREIERALGVEAMPMDLVGRHVVVTAGPTHEPLDPVRYLGNRSSGKMGFAIARACVARGARVTLVAGPVSLATPNGVTRVDVGTALEMQAAVDVALGGQALDGADALVMTAAVADFRPAAPSMQKLKKSGGAVPQIALTENPDVLAAIGARRAAKANVGSANKRPVLVGFALETGSDAELVAYAQKKLAAKGVDMIVANHAAEALGTETNRVIFVDGTGASPLEAMSKDALAVRIAAWIASQRAC